MMSDALEDELNRKLHKLQTTLRYWQTWEAEYAGLKEELEAESAEPDASRMLEIADQYESTIIDQAEMKSMLRIDAKPRRNRSQVLNVIKDRIETGRRNAYTVNQQIQRSAATSAPLQPNDQEITEDLMEITEELDDDDTILSSKVENYDQAMKDMADVLTKNSLVSDDGANARSTRLLPALSEHEASGISGSGSTSSFTDSKAQPMMKQLANDNDTATADGDILEEIGEQEKPDSNQAFGVMDDVRQNLNDLAPIVASLDLEDANSDQSWSDDDVESIDENEYGMHNISDEMDEAYIREMEALARKHGMRNLGPMVNDQHNEGVVATNVSEDHKVGQQDVDPSHKVKEPQRQSKGVRFADELDMRSAPERTSANMIPQAELASEAEKYALPLAELVVEKRFDSHQTDTEPQAKVSRFKAARLQKSTGGNAINLIPSPKHGQEKLDLKNEFALYNDRVAANNVDMRAFDSSLESSDAGADDGTRMSRFKAARLGLIDS